jgi:hypothetical protein
MEILRGRVVVMGEECGADPPPLLVCVADPPPLLECGADPPLPEPSPTRQQSKTDFENVKNKITDATASFLYQRWFAV